MKRRLFDLEVWMMRNDRIDSPIWRWLRRPISRATMRLEGRYPSKRGRCPLCRAKVLYARTSKGALEALTREPTDDGWILEEEGFTHVHDDHSHAVADLKRQGWRDDQIRLYELHYCGEKPRRSPGLTGAEHSALLIAAEKLGVEDGDYMIERDNRLFLFRVAITGHPIVEVTDEEIRRREPERR